ncbi:MAG: glutamyl-tRNA reductase [Burkholderiaceae bacterium]|nr:glutamyl-tRNA reductase [Burkholderiaceae bacterium]
MQIIAVGLNHTTAPLALREQVAFAPEQIGDAVMAARDWFGRGDACGGACETAILSTCNRTELYAACATPDPLGASVRFLANFHRLPADRLRPHLYALPQQNAVRHAFRVASGLDSMVLGEPQILGQMKDTVRRSQAAGGLGIYLNRMFQRTFAVAKEVRSTTDIGASNVSLAAAAVKLAQSTLGDLADKRVLFIGAGEMIALCATHFAAQQPASLAIANRTLERSEALAARIGGNTMRLADLPQRIAQYDIVISSTAASLPIIGLGMIERAIAARAGKQMLLLDLAVPRDMEAEIARLENVSLITLDDLGAEVAAGLETRQAAVVQAEAIIETRVQSFMHWIESRAAVPAIRSLREQGDTMRLRELARAKKRLARGEGIEAVLESLSKGLTAKFLHGSKRALREAQGDERMRLAELLPQLFRTRR